MRAQIGAGRHVRADTVERVREAHDEARGDLDTWARRLPSLGTCGDVDAWLRARALEILAALHAARPKAVPGDVWDGLVVARAFSGTVGSGGLLPLVGGGQDWPMRARAR